MTLSASLVVQRPGHRLEAELQGVDGITAVVGPSGVGKTTLLHALAGLVPAVGRVTLGGVDVGLLPAWRRRIGVVFQDLRLLPHLTVRDNLRFAAVDAGDVPAVAERLGVAGTLDRRPSTLSGGEARRVALGRTLLSRPRALLLDEPLVGLDRARRAEVLPWVLGVVRDAGVPALWVTHDAGEAQAVADRVVVLGEADGTARIVAQGDVLQLLAAGVRGAGLKNVLDVTDVVAGPEDTRGRWQDVRLALPPAPPSVVAASAGRVLLAPEDPILTVDPPGRTSARNVLDGVVASLQPGPSGVAAAIAIGTGHVVVDVTRAAVTDLGLEPGRRVFVLVKARALAWAG